jgi:phenylacetate-CoA ligase
MARGARVTPIVTDLWRRTQPIIRYRLNDVLRLDPAPCVCGCAFRTIAAIEGRGDDVCYFSEIAGGVRPFYPDTIRRMVLLASGDIHDYAVVQEAPGDLRIYLDVLEGQAFETIAAAVRASAEATVASYGCRLGTLRIERGILVAEPGVKRRRVRRTCDVVPVS